MPTSKRLATLALLALAGCDMPAVTRSAPEGITLPDGLVVAGASGWCVDTATTRRTADATVVIFGSCAALKSDVSEPSPSVPGIISVSVEGNGAGVPAFSVVEAFLRTDAGLTALSRDGNAASVEILETEVTSETLVLHAIDRSGLPLNTAEEYWRALLEIEGRVVTVSLIGAAADVGSDRAWRAALDEQVDRLRAANPA